MDPFQKKYGNAMATALIIPALVADVLWVARTLVSLGKLPHAVPLWHLDVQILCKHIYTSHSCEFTM